MSPQVKAGHRDAAAARAPRKGAGTAVDEGKGSARCLLSHDLLSELGPGGESDDLAQDGTQHAADSEQDSLPTTIGHCALTPALSATPSVSPPLNASWDWRTDVPEFVPCEFTPGEWTMAGYPGMGMLPPSACDGGDDEDGYDTFKDFADLEKARRVWSDRTLLSAEALLSSIWGMDDAAQGGSLASALGASTLVGTAAAGASGASLGGSPLISFCRAPGFDGEDAQVSPKMPEEEEQELRQLKDHMAKFRRLRLEGERAWRREKEGLLREIARYEGVLSRYAIPLEEVAGLLVAPEEFAPSLSSGDELAMHLQSFFPECAEHLQAAASAAAMEPAPGLGASGTEAAADGGAAAGEGRYVGALADPSVRKMAEDLEALTESGIDERALRAIQALTPADAAEVFRKVDDLVQQQGGRCRNLSSILQSICRKRERRSARSAAGSGADGLEVAPGLSPLCQAAPGLPMPDMPWGSPWGSPLLLPAASVAPPPGLEGYLSPAVRDEECVDLGLALAADQEWRCMEDTAASEERQPEAAEDSGRVSCGEYWNAERIAKVAPRGFDLKQRGDRWDLKLCMSSLDPPLTEQAMGCYCAWLRARLTAFRKDHGVQPLRRCCAEVDFSGNGLGNQSVWMLLETLAKSEVQVASLKLYKNNISLGGVLAICEFIRANRCAGPVHEMHLSHNEIEDEAALELLRTLQEQQPRYPPRRLVDGPPTDAGKSALAPVPVWVRLNQNRIMNPAAALKTLDAEGITYCAARNAHSCGPAKCARPDCPLVHLYLFTDQASTPPRHADGTDGLAAAAPPPASPAPSEARPPLQESRKQQRVWAPVAEPREPEPEGKVSPAASPERIVRSGDDAEAPGGGSRRKRSRKAKQ